MQLIFYAIAVYVLVLCINYLIIWQRLLRMPIRYPQYNRVGIEVVPTYLQELYQQPIEQLTELGFQFCEYVQVQSMIGFDSAQNWQAILYHQESGSYAGLTTRRPLEPLNAFDIEFYTFFCDRSLLLTINGKLHGMVGEIPHTVLQDPFTPDLMILWHFHQKRLEQLKDQKNLLALAPAELVEALQQHFTAHIDSLLQQRQIVPIKGSPLFQLTWQMALKLAISVGRGNAKVVAITKQRQQLAKTNPAIRVELPLELEVDGFHYMQDVERGHGQRKLGIWLLLGSLGFFIASFLPFFDIQFMLLLIGTLFLHELGHYLAMRLFRYQDTTMFFLPFFGAAVTGRKDDASLSEKVWVLLAGPMPGILLGIGMAIATRNTSIPHYAREGIWMLIGLNLLNLLPIYPLDGGKIVNLLLFSRYPFTDVLFKVFAVIVLGLMGFTAPVIWMIALLVAATIPTGFRSAKVDAKLRQKRSQLSSTDALNGKTPARENLPSGTSGHDTRGLVLDIFRQMQELGYGSLPFAQRYSLVKDLVQRHRESHANWVTRTFLTLFYIASLVVGVVGSVPAIAPPGGTWQRDPAALRHRQETRYREQIAAANRKLQQNPDDINAYLLRAAAYQHRQQYQEAIADLTQVIRLQPKNIQAYRQRAWVQYDRKEFQAALADVNQILKIDPKSADAYSLRSVIRRALGDKPGANQDRQLASTMAQAKQKEATQQILRRQPKTAQDYRDRADAHYQLGDYKTAVNDYTQALRLSPTDGMIYVRRGETRQQLGDYQGALSDATTAIQKDPDLPQAYQLRSVVYRRLGKTQQAQADQQTVLKLYQDSEAELP